VVVALLTSGLTASIALAQLVKLRPGMKVGRLQINRRTHRCN
jgi:hypothetical protein